MKEFTIIDTIQITRIVEEEDKYEEYYINENGKKITDKLLIYDDVKVLDHQVFIRDKEGDEK